MGNFQVKLTRGVKWKRLSFLTQFKIEFLLSFTGRRKVLGKMPVVISINVTRELQTDTKVFYFQMKGLTLPEIDIHSDFRM